MTNPHEIAESLLWALDHHRAGRIGIASSIYRKILDANPNHADALHLLGMASYQKDDDVQAVELIGRAIEINPDYADYHNNLGNIHHDAKRVDLAEACFRRALRIRPDYTSALHNLANVHAQARRFEEAVEHYERALDGAPKCVEVLNNLAIAQHELGQFEEAAECCRRALEIRPDFVDAMNNLGLALLAMGDLDEAEGCFQLALRLRRDVPQPHINLAVVCEARGKFSEAIAQLDRAIEKQPDAAESKLNRALVLLASGQWKEGWREYHWRFDIASQDRRTFDLPEWDGGDLSDKTILIVDEQGVGDQLMFASCIGDVIARARHVVIECKRRLVGLFERSYPQATVISKPIEPSSGVLDSVDVQTPLGSLPGHFRNSWNDFPRRGGYLIADDSRQVSWRDRFLAMAPGPVIGISWQGGTKPKMRRQRSIALDHLEPLLSVSGVNFVNLQYSDCAESLAEVLDDIRQKVGVRIHDWADADPLGDLDLWAAHVSALDLVISVDNSTVHMAGALGVPVWTLLPKMADWRWMQEREDSLWYPSMRLFRQTQNGVWTDTVEHVARALQMWRSRAARISHVGQSAPPAPRSPLDGRVFRSPQQQTTYIPTNE
jgi:tetratricopeptide (TPR) repeat protein